MAVRNRVAIVGGVIRIDLNGNGSFDDAEDMRVEEGGWGRTPGRFYTATRITYQGQTYTTQFHQHNSLPLGLRDEVAAIIDSGRRLSEALGELGQSPNSPLAEDNDSRATAYADAMYREAQRIASGLGR